MPLLVTEKAFVPDTGGAGRYRGGPAQRLSFKSVAETPITMTIRHERIVYPPRGLLGGGPGSPGRDLVNGEPIPAKAQVALQPGDVATFQTPGGGGMGPASERAAELAAADRAAGLVTPDGEAS